MQGCNKLILWFWWRWSSIPKFPTIARLPCFYNISKKKLEMKLVFLHADKHHSFLQADFNIATRSCNHYWWEWLSILKVLKVTSSQYLYSNIKKKLGIKFILCIQINIKDFTCWHYNFCWKQPYLKVRKMGMW